MNPLKFALVLCALLLVVIGLGACDRAAPMHPDAQRTDGWRSLEDLAEARIAVFSGTAQDLYATRAFPGALIQRFNSAADFVLALKTDKVDVALTDAVSIRTIARKNPDLAILADDYYDTPIGAAFRKGDETLRLRFDRFLEGARADGTLRRIEQRWLIEDPEQALMPDIPQPQTGEPLKVGISLLVGLPFVAQANGQFIGFDVELMRQFAAREGIRIEFIPLEFDALIAALAVGKIDLIASNLSITDERRTKVDFSEPYSRERSAALVRRQDLAAGHGLSPDTRGAGVAAPLDHTAEAPKPRTAAGWDDLDALSRGRIAVFTGTIQDTYVAQTYPDANLLHFNGQADFVAALKSGKVDAGLMVITSAREILRVNPDIGVLGDPVLPVSQAVAIRTQNAGLRARFDHFMAVILADGTLAEMRKRWFEGEPDQALMPEILLPEGGELLTVGTSLLVGLPFVGLVDGTYTGFDIELVRRFAASEGMRLKIDPLEFSALIPALAAGKVDLVASALGVTEERRRQVDFSTPYNEIVSVALALKSNIAGAEGDAGGQAATPPSLLEGLRQSVESNFVVEQRWRLILHGLWITFVISVLSTLLGTLIGALICALRMSERLVLRFFGSFYIALIRGLPVLLLLMIIFYIVFASINIDPVIVAVIAFGMNFGAYVSEMFRTGIEGVDRGQREAGIAMGFTRAQTFVFIVMPQAIRRILPVYRGEVISLIKMTSIVGYIGVQDLTKAGDIIRSRTFEAFFPLLMVAAIYFFVIWVMGLALDHLDRRTDPKLRLKGRGRS